MKIAVILGCFSIGTRPIDFDHLWDSNRGLTGTDLCFVRVCEELKALGHEVQGFCNVPSVDLDDTYQAVISINEPNLLMPLSPKLVRIIYMMLNDFSFVQPGFDAHVDRYIGVCQQHSDYVAKNSNTVGKWDTVALGCDPDLYKDERVPGRVIWCSSADRGLHWLLQQWPTIKQAVPEATLKIFYHMNYQSIEAIEPQDRTQHKHIVEMGQRVRYIRNALERLKPLGVEHVGSVSRNQMVQEWNQACVFGFSADTVAFSEGFSVSTLESHASFTVPVITDVDCLGGIYKDSGAIVIPSPVQNNLKPFTDAVIQGLTDKQFADQTIEKCRQFALNHTWKDTALAIEKIINNNMKNLLLT